MPRVIRCLICWLYLGGAWTVSAQQGSPGADVAALEAYKGRVVEMLAKETDPAIVQELLKVHRLLSLMQRSVREAAVKPKRSVVENETPPPSPMPSPPLAEAPPLMEEVKEPEVEISTSVEDPPESEAPMEKALPATVAKSPSAVAEVPKAPPVPLWFIQSSLRAGLGYQQNLLRSAFSDLDSPAALIEAEVEIFNTRREHNRWLGFGSYARTHFLDENSLRDEDLFFLFAQGEHRLSDAWWFGFRGDFIRAHQAVDDLDLSERLGGSQILTFQQYSVAPVLSWEPDEQWSMTWSLGYRREILAALPGFEDQSNDQGLFDWSLNYEPSSTQQIQLSYSYVHRDYDERLLRALDGSVLVGRDEALVSESHLWRLSHRFTWEVMDARWRWKNSVNLVTERANGPGYDDVDRWEFSSRLEAKFQRITASVEGRRGFYDYPARQISRDDTGRLHRDYWALRMEARITVGGDRAFWLRFEKRENAGKRLVDHYDYQGVYAGFEWTF